MSQTMTEAGFTWYRLAPDGQMLAGHRCRSPLSAVISGRQTTSSEDVAPPSEIVPESLATRKQSNERKTGVPARSVDNCCNQPVITTVVGRRLLKYPDYTHCNQGPHATSLTPSGSTIGYDVALMPNDQKPSTTKPGVVEKIIKRLSPDEPEKAQIAVEGADHLYREIRIENSLKNADGETVGLKEGAPVDVVIVADDRDTVKKPE